MCGSHLVFQIHPSFLQLLIFFDSKMSRPPEHCSTPHPSLSISMDHSKSKSKSKRAEKGGSGEEDVVEWVLMEECWSEAEGEGGMLEGCAVRFIQDPYSSLLVVQSSSSYITINGNEETCGSSFSDCGTSLMATLHSTTPFITPPMHDAFLSDADADDHDHDHDHEVLPTFLGFRDHENEELLPPNSQL